MKEKGPGVGPGVVSQLRCSLGGQVLYVHETDSGQELYNLREQRGWGTKSAFSPDGRVLVLAGAAGNIRLLNAATGEEHRTLRGHESPVASLAFSPDGKMLASGSEDTTIIRSSPTRRIRIERFLADHRPKESEQ